MIWGVIIVQPHLEVEVRHPVIVTA